MEYALFDVGEIMINKIIGIFFFNEYLIIIEYIRDFLI